MTEREADGCYPLGEPHTTGTLEVGDGHVLAWAEYGNPGGLPAISLHGGPGYGTSPAIRRIYDPERWRVITFDQRGSGESTPYASIEHNTTWDCVADIERLRAHLGIEQSVVQGGSWGATLALTYAITHPERVLGLHLRGVFLCRDRDIAWFYQQGASAIFPDAWARYRDFIPESEHDDLLAAYRRRLNDDDPQVRLEAARHFAGWEMECLRLIPNEETRADLEDDHRLVSGAQIETHYFVNRAFFDEPDWICARAGELAGIPIEIIHGRYDVVCPVEQAWVLRAAAPHANLVIVPDAGHAGSEPGIARAMTEAADRLFERLGPGLDVPPPVVWP